MEGRSRHGGHSAANHTGQAKQMADGLHILPRDLILLAGTLSGGIIRWAMSCQSGMCSGVAPSVSYESCCRYRNLGDDTGGSQFIGGHLLASLRPVLYHFDVCSGLDGWEPGAAERKECEEDPTREPGSHYLDRPATVHRGKMCSATDCRPVHLSCRYHTGKRSRMFQRPGTGVHLRHGAEFFSSLVARVR